MTRLLLDENFPRSAMVSLTAAGHDVLAVAVSAPGLSDRNVLALARTERRCLVTFDSDSGDLVFHKGEPSPPAIVYLRLHPIVSDEALSLTLRALDQPVQGWFIVATADALRRRPLQPALADRSF